MMLQVGASRRIVVVRGRRSVRRSGVNTSIVIVVVIRIVDTTTFTTVIVDGIFVRRSGIVKFSAMSEKSEFLRDGWCFTVNDEILLSLVDKFTCFRATGATDVSKSHFPLMNADSNCEE